MCGMKRLRGEENEGSIKQGKWLILFDMSFEAIPCRKLKNPSANFFSKTVILPIRGNIPPYRLLHNPEDPSVSHFSTSTSGLTEASPAAQAATNGDRAPNSDDNAKVALELAAYGRSGACSVGPL